jgi:hypothetical protein
VTEKGLAPGAATPQGPEDTTRGGAGSAVIVTGHDDAAALAEAAAELIAYSDTQDAWLHRVHDAWETGRRQGHAAGYAAGYAQAVTDWKVTVKDLTSTVPAYAELDRRRYPPNGRLAWLNRNGGSGG